MQWIIADRSPLKTRVWDLRRFSLESNSWDSTALSIVLHANGAMHEFRSEPPDSLSFRQLINLSGRCPLSSLIAVRQFGGLERSWLNGLWSDNEAAPSAIRGGILGKNRAFFWSLQAGEAAETETEACSFVASWKPFTIMERSLDPSKFGYQTIDQQQSLVKHVDHQ